MQPPERQALEQSIDRHIRRGEFADAARALRSLQAAFPEEPSIGVRLAELETQLSPADRIASMRPTARAAAATPQQSPVDSAEAFASAGRFQEALEIYQQLLAQRPDSELVRERIAELSELARVVQPPRPSIGRKTAVLEHLLERISSRRRT